MAADDASSAEMRQRPTNRDADPLALDEDTVEQLLTGALPPTQAPAGYAKVAELLTAAAAAPTPEELAGQGAALAELRAVVRARRPAAAMASGPAIPRQRRRRTGLAVVVVVGALVTGGAAGAATGHLPGPVGEAARNILGAGGSEAPSASTEGDQPPVPVTRPTGPGGGLPASRPGSATGSGPGAGGAGSTATSNLEGLCQAFLSGSGAEKGGKLDATAFEALARAAGGQDKVPAYCQALLPGYQKANEQGARQPEPSDSGGQGQGGPPAGTGSGGQGVPPTSVGGSGQGGSPDPSSPSPSQNR
jgi:hypothetical protein